MIRFVVVLACALFVPATALAQMPAIGLSAPGAGINAWHEEPNVNTPGCIPYTLGNPSSCYPADANGITAAKAGETTLVLQAKWAPYQWPMTVVTGTWGGVGLSGVFNQDVNSLFDAFTTNDYMTPATEFSITAFHGYWNDVNGDGFRDEEGHWRNSVDGHDRQIFVNADGRHNCEQQDPSVDPNGNTRVAGGQPGNLAPAVDVPVGVSYRCTTPDEWSPPPGWGTAPPEVVGYIAPSPDWFTPSTPELTVPCPIYAAQTNEDCEDTSGQQTPDFWFTPTDFYGDGTYSWEFVFDVTTDGSVVETKVITVISSPQITHDGPRSHEVGPESLVDVDVYSSLDPLLESLYHDNLWGAADAINTLGLDPAAEAYTTTVCPALPACGEDVSGAGDVVVGPAWADVTGPEADTPEGYTVADYQEARHLYLNLRVAESRHVGAVATAYTGHTGLFTPVAGDTGQYCPDLSGSQCHAVLRLEVSGWFGSWLDVNGDGFVGNPATSPGCDDAYDCGMTEDPNEYVDSNEWTGLALQGPVSGHSFVTLTTADGKWGPFGAYKFHDATADCASTQGCRAQFNPWDDAVEDAADGSPSLVTSGPIVLTVVSPSGGFYYSWEDVLVPGVSALDVTMTTNAFTVSASTAGTAADETVVDVDTY